MATITITPVSTTTSSVVSVVTLDGTDDTFALTSKTGLLILSNDTGGSLSPVITGDGSTTFEYTGAGLVDVSGGTDAFGAIADGTEKVLKVNVKKEYLKGTITITGGTGLVARYLEL